MKLTELKGVGPKTSLCFEKLNIHDTKDLIHHFPRTYDVFEEPVLIDEIDNKAVVSIDGVILKSIEMKQFQHLTLATTVIRDASGDRIKVNWFNQPYLRSVLKRAQRYIFRGRVKRTENTMTLEQPEIFPLATYEEKIHVMQPVYSLTKGISNNQMTKFVLEALHLEPEIEYLDETMRKKFGLCERSQAVKTVHFPKNMEDLKQGRNRLAFDEFFMFLYQMQKLKEKETLIKNNMLIEDHRISSRVIEHLGFSLTNAQKRVLDEIHQDVSGPYIMQRLIQGDVGSGKTIVAVLTMLDFAAAGKQSALMVPTEVLANQHYETIKKLLSEHHLDFEVVLLTGSVKGTERKRILSQIETGEAKLIVGTHAIFQEQVIYHELALVVIDEQHRFGVLQRAKLMEKGENPHTIVMSATPIPRTLAIILYGNMDISIIDELPANRLSIKNCVVTKSYRPNAYRFIDQQAAKGRQVYVICPMVEENDMLEAENVVDYAEMLKSRLSPEINIAYLHGKMKPAQKAEILGQFEQNQIQVLVSTTVIEVGINVPNATVMMVENAERFSLASLHQLRGRVGRGTEQSYCIFVSATQNPDKLKRLEILNQSNDGFYIASQDLKLRGPGDFFGIRQSGEMQFQFADVLSDGKLLHDAKKAVDEFVNAGHELIDKQMNHGIVIY